MATQKTIAIIGAQEKDAINAVEVLAATGHRLLLFYKGTMDAPFTENENIEWISCPKEASWEADLIFLAVPKEEHGIIAKEIKDVATGKGVIDIKNNEADAGPLVDLLPLSTVLFCQTGFKELTDKFLSQ